MKVEFRCPRCGVRVPIDPPKFATFCALLCGECGFEGNCEAFTVQDEEFSWVMG
jgi:transcription elongation factor Elf1